MAARVQEYNETAGHRKVTVSIEVEKTKIPFSSFAPLADVVSHATDIDN